FGGVAGIYMPRVSGSVSFTHRDRGDRNAQRRLDPRTVLFHEYTHHFLANNFAFGAPLWFSEGYPEFWSTTDFLEDGSVRFGLPGTHRSLELTELPRIRVDQLLTMRHPIADRETIAAIYGRGWVLSHYLSFEPSRAGQLDSYLRALGEGRSAEEAARAFGDLAELNRNVEQYMRRNRFSIGTLSAAQVPPGPIQIRNLREGEEAIMQVRMRSKRGVNDRQARALVPEGRRIGQRFPNDPLVQVILAEVEYDAGNFAEAGAAADRALAADPNLVDAHLFKARSLWGPLTAANERSAERWRAVRQWISSANRIDPDDPEPLVAFFESMVESGQRPSANAVEGLIYAQTLAREDRSLRITAARQLLIQRQAAPARALLAPLASDSHSGSLGVKMAEILALLEAGDSAGALTKIDEALAEQRQRPRAGGS
ncbi:hypothetical protein, partial [Allosphingosinicella sp.]|uniref:hypothetical protein n=1 Tax=Allosphingosinicella sp. TaxID=2823234 RepID=UPI002EF53967